MSVKLNGSLRKSASEIEVKLVFFAFFHWLFNESINQECNLLLDCAFEPFTYSIYAVKIICYASLPFVLNVG